ncbi:hypothetical protein Trydic_g4682 [Trypoxylus dichotomus]
MPSQGNINTINFLELINGTIKIIVSSLKRHVFCLEYLEKSNSNLIPCVKEISFTYIPSSAEIITLNAFNKSEVKNDFVIGITIIKNSKDVNAMETYLNIYSEYEENGDFNIENLAQNCLNVQLNFIPHFHGHTELIEWKNDEIINREMVFLLTGSDSQFHIFREDMNSHSYQEINPEEYFPEFYKCTDIVTWIEIYYLNSKKERLTVFGTDTGYVRLCRICTKTNAILLNHSTNFISYVSHIKIYCENKIIPRPDFLLKAKYQKDQVNEVKEKLLLNVIIANTSVPSVFFRDCLTYGMDNYKTLRRCDPVSVTSCIEVADIDFDGHDEIVLGNSRQELLLYKFDKKEEEWRILETKNVVSPIFRIKYIDITSDGVRELVVFTMKGLYIFQHDADYIQKKLEEKLYSL